jgi:hypothetical protein
MSTDEYCRMPGYTRDSELIGKETWEKEASHEPGKKIEEG